MRVTLIHPAIGRRVGADYIRSWQMEPLAPAVLAARTPPGASVRFFDDRLETIDFDAPTDLVALSVETYTARRAYQIASEYRRRKVPVVMGGFHATLLPEEVADFAEAVVVGEAEGVWPELLADAAAGRLQRSYRGCGRPALAGVTPDRSIFAGKRYLPVALVEASRGCRGGCEFCAISSFYGATQTFRPPEEIVAEIGALKGRTIFFVDDNLTGDRERALELLTALALLRVRWIGQASLAVAADEELLQALVASGCQGLLIGLESLDGANLAQMGKGDRETARSYAVALERLRAHGIRLYATFVFGYDGDDPAAFARTLAFAKAERFYLAAFNHLTPFPGTPLYRRLEEEGRLRFPRWWLDPGYRYGQLPFDPKGMAAEALEEACVAARRAFFGWPSIVLRSLDFRVNSRSPFMWFNFFGINALMRREVLQRKSFPLGDEGWTGIFLKVGEGDGLRL